MHRRLNHRSPAQHEFECQFEFPAGAFTGLGVRDPRVSCKLIAIDPGDNSMNPVASDVFSLDMGTSKTKQQA